MVERRGWDEYSYTASSGQRPPFRYLALSLLPTTPRHCAPHAPKSIQRLFASPPAGSRHHPRDTLVRLPACLQANPNLWCLLTIFPVHLPMRRKRTIKWVLLFSSGWQANPSSSHGTQRQHRRAFPSLPRSAEPLPRQLRIGGGRPRLAQRGGARSNGGGDRTTSCQIAPNRRKKPFFPIWCDLILGSATESSSMISVNLSSFGAFAAGRTPVSPRAPHSSLRSSLGLSPRGGVPAQATTEERRFPRWAQNGRRDLATVPSHAHGMEKTVRGTLLLYEMRVGDWQAELVPGTCLFFCDTTVAMIKNFQNVLMQRRFFDKNERFRTWRVKNAHFIKNQN